MPKKMKSQIVDGVEITLGSGNVFADLGLPDADSLKIKSGLVIEITRAIRKLGLTQTDAAARMGIAQAKVSRMMRGDFANLSERKLMDCLNRLGVEFGGELTGLQRHRKRSRLIFGLQKRIQAA
jgi:predicted XRE-type DNA-binding protein